MRGRFDSLLVLLVALPVYLATGQRTLYGVDGWRLLRRAATDDVRSEMHLLYKPMAVAAKQIGALLDVPMLESVVALSGVGTAVGVALVHAAARRFGLGRGDALWVAVLVGTAPGVWFYATVVERHGPFFAFVGLSAWALAWFAVRPGPWAALGFSLAVSLAAQEFRWDVPPRGAHTYRRDELLFEVAPPASKFRPEIAVQNGAGAEPHR